MFYLLKVLIEAGPIMLLNMVRNSSWAADHKPYAKIQFYFLSWKGSKTKKWISKTNDMTFTSLHIYLLLLKKK